MGGSEVITGASEILTLLRVLGEGYRLACLYKCQVLIISGENADVIYITYLLVYCK